MSIKPCLVCNLEIKTAGEFIEHMLSHLSLKLFDCPNCNRSYKYSRNRASHMRFTHKLTKRLKNPITKMTVLSNKPQDVRNQIITILINCTDSSTKIVLKKPTNATQPSVNVNQESEENNKIQSPSSSYVCDIPSCKHIEDTCSTSTWRFDPTNIKLEVDTFPDEQLLNMQTLKHE